MPERRTTLWPFLIAALAMVCIFFVTQTRWDGDSRPNGGLEELRALSSRPATNVLFVLVDTLRADHLGSYGYTRDTSPTLDRLASTGIRFADHMAQSSWTKTSMASLWTSLYPGRVGVLRAQDVLPAEARMPAERLREKGYRTVALWRNGWVAPTFGFEQGFESYVSPRPGPPIASLRRENPGIKLTGNDFDIVDSMEEFLRTPGDEPWFLYAHLMDVHQYAADMRSSLFGSRYLDAYDNSIHFVDRAIERMLALLDDRDLRSRTIVVVASDHGEAFGEHGFEGHARDLHAEVTRTPWIIGLPFRLASPLAIQVPTQNVDLWPTLFELLGIDFEPEAVDGRSVMAEILSAAEAGPSPRAREAVDRVRVAHLDGNWGKTEQPPRPLVAASHQGFRLLHAPSGDMLFETDSDRGERIDLLAREPGVAQGLRERVERYLAEPPVWRGGVPRVELDDMELGHLRALGYVVGE